MPDNRSLHAIAAAAGVAVAEYRPGTVVDGERKTGNRKHDNATAAAAAAALLLTCRSNQCHGGVSLMNRQIRSLLVCQT